MTGKALTAEPILEAAEEVPRCFGFTTSIGLCKRPFMHKPCLKQDEIARKRKERDT